jgi:flagellar basal body P-ring protein FlgI
MKKTVFIALSFYLSLAMFVAGCGQNTRKVSAPKLPSGAISSFAEVVAFVPIPVQGYGLVAGLPGTGSGQCPPQIRAYLKQYILTQLPKDSFVSADRLIDSPDTAIVKIDGMMPPGGEKGEIFDVRVTVIPGTKATSLADGRLYTANLALGASSKPIATAQGPVFIDVIDGTKPTTGYILGGGTVLETYNLALNLYQPDFRLANMIRNRINEQFGDGTVSSSSTSTIHVQIPPQYTLQKDRFVTMLKQLYINETPQHEAERAKQLINDLGDGEKAAAAEIALEAVGRTEEPLILQSLDSGDPQSRFRAARCLLYLGDEQGLGVLRQTAIDSASPYRIEAIEAIALGAKRNDAVAILKQFLADSDLKVRIGAYEQLRRLDAPSISTFRIADDFDVDQIFSQGTKMIYVYRSGKPRIAIFGAPLTANHNIFIESADATVILNSPAENKYVSIMRKHPKRNAVLGPLKSDFDLVDIIRTLCEPVVNKSSAKSRRLGLGLPYADTIAILQIMCTKGALEAEFAAGPLPKFNPDNVMK